jgi:hypothetical protein
MPISRMKWPCGSLRTYARLREMNDSSREAFAGFGPLFFFPGLFLTEIEFIPKFDYDE